ncbi:MAG: AmmeMemoRadiSam system radical SAM enzyme [Promethearchaeota archaeon]
MSENKVRCGICERRCVIRNGELGFCKTRQNIDGSLYTLIFGDLSSISTNPIEKKPLFHFFPGSYALTVGSWSCNFTCPWCQNSSLSKTKPNSRRSNYMSPEIFEKTMKANDCIGSSISFNEPTLLLEYSLDVFDTVKEAGPYYNTYVTNMYMTEEALKLLIEHKCDAFAANMKGDAKVVKKHCGADVELVWRNLKLAKEMGAHVEVITLVIPTINDNEQILTEIAIRIRDELGKDTPWHCTRFHPAYKSRDLGLKESTPIASLERAYEIGKNTGLRFVYLGNVPNHPYENTYCPSCNKLLIKRFIFDSQIFFEAKKRIDDLIYFEKKCPHCGERIEIQGEFTAKEKGIFGI